MEKQKIFRFPEIMEKRWKKIVWEKVKIKISHSNEKNEIMEYLQNVHFKLKTILNFSQKNVAKIIKFSVKQQFPILHKTLTVLLFD